MTLHVDPPRILILIVVFSRLLPLVSRLQDISRVVLVLDFLLTFLTLVGALRCSHLFMSYSDDGHIPHEQVLGALADRPALRSPRSGEGRAGRRGRRLVPRRRV